MLYMIYNICPISTRKASQVSTQVPNQPPAPPPTPPPTEQLIVNGVSFSHDDFHQVVEDFYGRVQQDAELSIPFLSVHDWPDHIRRLTHFWWIRFGGRPYMFAEYNPVAKHYYAGFNANLLERWLGLFEATLTDRLQPDQAALWIMIAKRIGFALTAKDEAFRHAMENKS